MMILVLEQSTGRGQVTPHLAHGGGGVDPFAVIEEYVFMSPLTILGKKFQRSR